MTTFFAVLLGLLVWMTLGVFVAFCVSAGNGAVSLTSPVVECHEPAEEEDFQTF